MKLRSANHVVLILSFFLCNTTTHAADPNAGASHPKPLTKLNEDHYKRIHQYALRMLERDQPSEAKSTLDAFLEDHPDDAESHFLMGIYHANRQNVTAAVASLKKALRLGMHPSRVIAGPRDLLLPLKGDPFYEDVANGLAHEPIHGPLVGNVTDEQATVWIRTAKECSVRLHVSTNVDMTNAIVSEPIRSTAASDFTAKPTVRGLLPHTKYHYQLEIDGQLSKIVPQNLFFTTFRQRGDGGKLTLAFGGGAGFVPEHERMWDTIHQFMPDALLLLGDNVYIDDPESVAQQQYTYYRRQSRSEFRQLTAITPTFTIWDDHDFGTNDCWGGPQVDLPAWKRNKAWPIYRQNWPNPGFGGGDEQPGCWYTFSAGDIDFVMLDCRYYRTDPTSDQPSMLGPVQMAWLKETLPKLTGTFKVLCSSVPWEYRTKGDSHDTWNGYRSERAEIFAFLNEAKIEGILLMSADRHRSDAWKVDNPDGYDFYEFNSSRLTNQHVHPEMKEAIFSYNKKQSFGLVTFDTQIKDPTATYDVINIDGEKVHTISVKRSQLQAE